LLIREGTTAIDWAISVARLELAALETGLRLWRHWIDLGGTLTEDLHRIGLGMPRSMQSPAAEFAVTAPAIALGRFFGQLSQFPFQVAMQLLVEATAFLATLRAPGDASRDEIAAAIDHVREASHLLSRTTHAVEPDTEGTRDSARRLARIAESLDEIRLLLQRRQEAPRGPSGADHVP